jgi:hypothetical protein
VPWLTVSDDQGRYSPMHGQTWSSLRLDFATSQIGVTVLGDPKKVGQILLGVASLDDRSDSNPNPNQPLSAMES